MISRLLFFISRVSRRPRRFLIMFAVAVILLVGLLLPIPYLIYKPPSSLIGLFQSFWPDVLWRVQTSEKIVALTIDDAPSRYTDEILEVLKENDVLVTFFVIGSQAKGREGILQNIVRTGSELGNHAWRDEPSLQLSSPMLVDQIHAVEKIISEAYTGSGSRSTPPRYFRPGSGIFNSRMRKMIKALGYRLVLGSIYPHDAQISYPGLNAKHILSMVRPGAIIICHDRRSWTAPMLRKVLPELKERGYRVVSVTMLLEEAGVIPPH